MTGSSKDLRQDRDAGDIVAVIPARYASLRFPGKPLAILDGKPIIEHVVNRANEAKMIDRVIVATDDERIERAVSDLGGEVVMTSPDHPTGTDRIGEAVSNIDCEIVVNVQGDEPVIDPRAIDAAVKPLIDDRILIMSTLSVDIVDMKELTSPNVVKVITDRDGFALYFSRSPIPASRNGKYELKGGLYKKHVGLYVFRKDFLMTYIELPTTPLEEAEKLEQLRALENGYRIKVISTSYDSIGVDTPDDLERLNKILKDGELTL